MILPCITRRIQVPSYILEAEQCQSYPSWLKGKLIQQRDICGDEREDEAWRVAMGISFPLLPLQPKETLSNWGALIFPTMYYKMEENHSFSSMLCRVLIMFHKDMKERNIDSIMLIYYNSEIWWVSRNQKVLNLRCSQDALFLFLFLSL